MECSTAPFGQLKLPQDAQVGLPLGRVSIHDEAIARRRILAKPPLVVGLDTGMDLPVPSLSARTLTKA